MAIILFPFNAHTPQFVSVQRLLEAAPLVAEHIEAGRHFSLGHVLHGLGIRPWNHRAAVEQFAFALSFHHPLDPSKVRQAKECLTGEGYVPEFFRDVAWDAFVEGSRAMITTAVHEGRVPSAGEIVEGAQLAVMIARGSPLLPLDKSGRDALVDEISSLATVFSSVLPSYLKGIEAATPQEGRGRLFTQEVLERFPGLRDREQLIRVLAEQIFAVFGVAKFVPSQLPKP